MLRGALRRGVHATAIGRSAGACVRPTSWCHGSDLARRASRVAHALPRRAGPLHPLAGRQAVRAMSAMPLDFPHFRKQEVKWQKRWESQGGTRSPTPQPGADSEPFYALPMFPYPSGALAGACALYSYTLTRGMAVRCRRQPAYGSRACVHHQRLHGQVPPHDWQ